MKMKNETDISPAIQELKKLHGLLLDHIESNMSDGELNKGGMGPARDTVISVLPGDRRREDGQYKWRLWEKKSDEILHELDSSHKVKKYHEIFVTGESLSRPKEEIVLLMMHQVAHQAAQVQSTQSYHSEWIRIWLNRLFGVPEEAVVRDEVMGYYAIDQTKLGDAGKLVRSIASRLQEHKFDLFRVKLTKRESTGKMYKWTCACGRPAVRTGGILRATCDQCNQPFKIEVKGVRPDFLRRVPEDLRWPIP